MLLVDDHLAARALSGRRMVEWGDEVPMLPWMLHVRLLRSWLDSSTRGSLSAEASTDALRAALAPSPQVLRILDPRPYAASAVQLMLEQKVSLLAAELLSAAIANRASLYLYKRNVGRKWPEMLAASGVELRLYDKSEMDAATGRT